MEQERPWVCYSYIHNIALTFCTFIFLSTLISFFTAAILKIFLRAANGLFISRTKNCNLTVVITYFSTTEQLLNKNTTQKLRSLVWKWHTIFGQSDRSCCEHFQLEKISFFSWSAVLFVHPAWRPRGHIFCILVTGTPIVGKATE